MPIYDYYCPHNGRVVEVRHSMNERLKTWGEVCRQAGIDPGETPLDAPVEKLISAGHYIRKASTCRRGACRREEVSSCCGGRCRT